MKTVKDTKMTNRVAVAAALLVLLAPASAMRASPAAMPCSSGPAASHRPAVQMVDPALMADASAMLLPALVGSPMAIDPNYDPHTLSNLGPDIFNTCVLATVGLMGAYVTQGTEGFAETEAERKDKRRLPPRPRRLQQYDYDDFFKD